VTPTLISRRRLLAASTLLSLSALALPMTAPAQPAWPTRPIRIVVPFSPGSFTDVAARTLAAELTEDLGQPVVVENRGGAGGTIGATMVASAAPDGYTVLVTDNSFVMSAALYDKLAYDPLTSFVQVSQLAESPSLLVARPGLPVKDVGDLLALARAKPGELNFGSGGVGSSAHLATEQLMNVAGIRMTHVPFKGVAAAIADVMADRIDVSIASLASGMAQVRDGRVKGLAVSGDRRSRLLPDTPTFAESGVKDYDMSYWWGIAVPAGTPEAIVARINQAVVAAAAKPRLTTVFAAQGADPVTSTPGMISQRIEREIATWKAIKVKAGVKVE
jgi:tripartite-type tricarboxylate transporter receptor subunit TctC